MRATELARPTGASRHFQISPNPQSYSGRCARPVHASGGRETPRGQVHKPDADLRDTEAFFLGEVVRHVPKSWVNSDATEIGDEVIVTRRFRNPQPSHTPAKISGDVLEIEKGAEGLLDDLPVGATQP